MSDGRDEAAGRRDQKREGGPRPAAIWPEVERRDDSERGRASRAEMEELFREQPGRRRD